MPISCSGRRLLLCGSLAVAGAWLFFNQASAVETEIASSVWPSDTASSTAKTANAAALTLPQSSESMPATASSATFSAAPNPPLHSAPLKLNELNPYPTAGTEWVELYNPTGTAVELAGWLLCDSRATAATCKPLSGTILGQAWLTIDLKSARYLNNDTDQVKLKDPAGNIIDELAYGDKLVPRAGLTLARRQDGADTDQIADWALTTDPTPGSANRILPEEKNSTQTGLSPAAPEPAIASRNNSRQAASSREQKDAGPNNEAASPGYRPQYTPTTTPLIISELYPNPPGSDTKNEFIELFNQGPDPVELSAWKLADAAATATLTGVVPPLAYLSLPRSATNIALNNTGEETIRLIDPGGGVVETVKYNDAEEGLSFSRGKDSRFRWSEEATPGAANMLVAPDDVAIAWKALAPENARPNEPVTFDAALSADPRGGLLAWLWSFSDGHTTTSPRVTRSFATTGTFAVSLQASSSAGTNGEKNFTITIDERAPSRSALVVISEIFPDPVGQDSAEFIELFNPSSSTVELSHWQLATLSQRRAYTLPAGTAIPPRGFLTFWRTATYLALRNSAETVVLRAPSGAGRDRVKLTAADEGQSLARFGEEWRWTNTPTPGQANQLSLVRGEVTAALLNSPVSSRPVERPPSLAEARLLPHRTIIVMPGKVSAPPGTFAKNAWYVSDDTGGLGVYLYRGAPPPLKLGDQIELRGEIRRSKNNIKLALSPGGWKVLGPSQTTTTPEVTAISELDEAGLGQVARVAGEITGIKRGYWFLDDGEGEITITLKQRARINQTRFKEGDRVEITGIIEEGSRGLTLWPRGDQDIATIGRGAEIAPKAAADKPHPARTYGLTTLGGTALLTLAYWFKKAVGR